MAFFLLGLAVLTLLFYLVIGSEIVLGSRSIPFLKDLPPLSARPLPTVSILIPARNEERNIEEALGSVLHLDYEDLEIVAVDDRSTDGTGAILDRMAATDPRVRVVHVTELPPGWLGKNHALHLGSESARGELLLFTDADIVMEPSTLRRAVGRMAAEGLDHLTASPQVNSPSLIFEMFMGTFAFFFALFTRPWKVKDPKSPRHIGIGAFNLVRASAYHAAGGHRAIAMRPDDDLKLGKLLKKNGFRQEFVFGQGAIRVEWYTSVRELVQGMMKNAFPGIDYSIPAVLGATLAMLFLNLWPFVAVFATGGATRLLNLATVLLILSLCWINAPLGGVRRWYGITFPFGVLLFLYILWRSTVVTLWNDGIDWRGTHYPLAELKANKV